ncbi:gamma-glutamyl-gamma-aminobutyrate hydrolase family protein [Sediminitomix flava]|uniref:Putative glutamine amidotransferase n=1 Tax=Sediminitomix flava TaxID=379075 RepID=A0A315ZBM9_SEDFL|nr:gamma-glutamyl-gamma-aminobutyrate hydrolase family protein [Sediminitomix flava]PWJ42986.1 putative glutamine amidotransferase [Sediminitomix flava]
MLKLGVSSCFEYANASRAVFAPKQLCYLEKDMGRFLARKDVLPLLIPDLEDELLYKYLSELDAIVIQGGSDISPQTYGEEAIENGRWPGDRYRDIYELKIIDFAVKNKIPLWGICRGFQLINVYFGGTLYQDISTQNKATIQHRDAERYDQLAHAIYWNSDSPLYQVYNQNEGNVNSIHHQGVKALASDLIAIAHSSEDDIIEAFVHKEYSHIWGVQWHPEFIYNYKGNDQLLDAEKLYDYFLESFT